MFVVGVTEFHVCVCQRNYILQILSMPHFVSMQAAFLSNHFSILSRAPFMLTTALGPQYKPSLGRTTKFTHDYWNQRSFISTPSPSE